MEIVIKQVVFIGVLIFLLWSLYTEKFPPVITFFIAISILVLFNILSPKEVLLGFSNISIATVIMLLIISNILQKTGFINSLFSKILHTNLTYKKFLSRMYLITSFLSAFLNNTPIVVMLLPHIYHWSKTKNIYPSKLLIPLSYAAIIGGTATLLGTSTNLIINGFMIEYNLKPFHIFDFSYIGIPLILVGFLYLYFIGHKLLPNREDPLTIFLKKKKEYLVETVVKQGSKLIGKTIQEANLRNLKNLFLVEIIRGDKKIYPVSPSEVIEEGDILIFVGQTEAITDLIMNNPYLSLPRSCYLKEDKLDIVEVVITPNSALINKKVKETDFRAKYNAAILAIHRNGEKLKGKIGEIILKPGDLLLLLTGKDFWKIAEDTTDFYIISKVKEIYSVDTKKGYIIGLSFLFIIILSSFKVISLFSGLLILLCWLIIFRIISYSELKKSIDINFTIIAAFSIALGKAIENIHLINTIINGKILSSLGPIGALFTIYAITNLLTEFITNIAAASIGFPIAVTVAKILGLDPTPFILTVAFAASASFISPVGYQTNLIVYSVGNYKFKDFLKVGLPLSILYAITCITSIYFFFF
jgi:di/tricarboxylate transporter